MHPFGQARRQADEYGKQQGKSYKGYNPVAPALRIAGHIGIEMLNDDGKERQFNASPKRIERQAPCSYALRVLSAHRERQRSSEGKQKRRKHQVDPSQTGQIGVEHMVGRRHLGMIHPSWQYAVYHRCAKHHGEDGVAAQGVERQCSLLHCAFVWFIPFDISFHRLCVMM